MICWRAMSIDVLIRGGQIVDGAGNTWFYGDVALSGRSHHGAANLSNQPNIVAMSSFPCDIFA